MIEFAIILIIVLVVLWLVIYAAQNLPIPGAPPFLPGVIIAVACVIAAIYLANRFLN